MQLLAGLTTAMAVALASPSFAGCVINAKSKQWFVVLDSHTFVLQGGLGPDILVKTYAFLYRNSQITVLKDNFCSFDSSAIYIDGDLAGLQQVEQI
jgi:hypothetical protein